MLEPRRAGLVDRTQELDGFLRVTEYRDGQDLIVRAEEREEPSPQVMRRELRYGFFSRDLQLPAGVTEEDPTATYADGILEVRVHLPDEAPPTRIAVTAR
jgi:HSP20 family protein